MRIGFYLYACACGSLAAVVAGLAYGGTVGLLAFLTAAFVGALVEGAIETLKRD